MFQDTQPAPLPAEDGREAWGEFRVGHPGEIVAMMRQLRDGGVPVQLCAPGGASITTSVWSVDDERRRMNFAMDAGHAQLPAMLESDELVAVAYLESVKLQFDVDSPVLVRGVGAAALQAPLPRSLYRFQRRGAYRVRTLERHSPTAQLRHPSMPDMLLPLRVIDVSIGGCALFVGEDVPPLQPGTRVAGVRVALDADTRFEAGLQLQHVTAIQPGAHGVRVGCEWVGLAPSAERVLQRYIDNTQKRRRLLSLD